MNEKIAIIGAGAWGTAIAAALARNGHTIMLWTRSNDLCTDINTSRLNKKYLPGYPLPAAVTAHTSLEIVCKDAALILLAVPSLYLKTTVEQMLPIFPFIHPNTESCPIIGVLTKGFIPDEQGTPQFIIDALQNILPHLYKDKLVYIAGPSHGEEVAAGKLTGLIAASTNPLCSIRCRELMKSRSLLVYSSLDVIGVQVCAATKNVIAIAFGMLDALTENSTLFGDNTESLLLAAGLNEIQVIGRAMGATHSETFTSIAGVGDLDVTCRSKYGRNRRFGRDVIKSNILRNFKDIDDMITRITTIGYLPEGVAACKFLNTLARQHNLKLPICTGLYGILNQELTPVEFIENLLTAK
ncbi:MAG: NAD(P)H-dependent glycerol-3-phosphate dehydrogenase [Treponema sp.]